MYKKSVHHVAWNVKCYCFTSSKPWHILLSLMYMMYMYHSCWVYIEFVVIHCTCNCLFDVYIRFAFGIYWPNPQNVSFGLPILLTTDHERCGLMIMNSYEKNLYFEYQIVNIQDLVGQQTVCHNGRILHL